MQATFFAHDKKVFENHTLCAESCEPFDLDFDLDLSDLRAWPKMLFLNNTAGLK
jgi:hypothetical protein